MTWSSASTHRVLCDLKFCISTSTHGIFFGLKFRHRTRNILRLKVPRYLPNVRILVTRRLIRSCLIRTKQTKTIPAGTTAKRAQLRTAPPKWLWQGPSALCSRAPDFCIRNQRDSTYRLLCDLKFRFRTLTIMWLEVLQFRFHTWNILWLEVPPPHKEYTET